MNEKIQEYFAKCEETKREPTAPGLCLALGVSVKELEKLALCSGEVRSAIYRITDSLEQRHDANAKFLLRQRIYGGYSDDPGKSDMTVRVKLKVEEEKTETENEAFAPEKTSETDENEEPEE